MFSQEDTNRDRKEINKKLYDDYCKEVESRVQYNVENYDKSILSLSTTILGLSMAFIKDIVPLQGASYKWLLYTSWTSFVLSIVFVMISFYSGKKASLNRIDDAYEYYVEDNDDAFNKKDYWYRATELLNNFSGITFIIGIILTVCFVGFNLTHHEKGISMDKKNEKGTSESSKESKVIKGGRTNDGAIPAQMPPKKDNQPKK